MSQKRVLYIIESLDQFGATRQLDLLTGELAAEVDVHIAVLDSESPLPQSLGANASRTFHYLAASGHSDSVRSLTRSGFRLRKLIQKLQPNILHAWCHRAQRVALAASMESDSIKKFVTELHLRPSTNMTLEAIDQRLGKDVGRYIVSHEEVKKSLVSHQYDADRIEIIPSAIGPIPSSLDRETARRKLMQLGEFGDHVNIAGAVAPLVARSRLKDLIWATDLLTCIRDDVHFFIFGRGPQRWRLEKFASQTEAGHHVHFIDSELHGFELIPGLDFFWQSHLNESLPSALCHAMQCEVPVVSVYGPGTTELITPQETGFAANFGARDEFARWTKYLLEKTDSAKQLAEQGRASLEGKFPVREMVDAYRKLYDGA